MYPAKKPLRFVRVFVILLAVSSEILSEISPFALFFVQKQLKKHDVPLQKNRYVLWKMSFFCRRFFWNTAWNLTFCPIFCQKKNYKNTTFFTKRNGFFAGEHVFLIFFWQKKGQRVRFQREFQKKPPEKKRQFSQNVTVFFAGYIVFF